MSLNQREENTPSPVSKEDGSNKRILINQGNPTSKPPQPPAIMDPPVNTPHVAMEINVTTSGQDGNESINSNPNNNPNPNPNPTIKFTKSISDTVITYLDLDIYKKDNILHTRTHFKSTNTFSYLHGQSNHPSSTFKGVTKGENIRILRNTSEEEIYQNTMEFINKQFKIRKYPDHFTTTPIVPFSQRQSFLHSTRSTSSHIGPTFITTHDSSISLKPILEEDWPRITSHNELRKTYRETPRITYKHSPNLSQLLTRAKLDHDIKNDLPYHPAPTIQSISFPAKNIKCRHQQAGLVHNYQKEAISRVIKQNIIIQSKTSTLVTPLMASIYYNVNYVINNILGKPIQPLDQE